MFYFYVYKLDPFIMSYLRTILYLKNVLQHYIPIRMILLHILFYITVIILQFLVNEP